jgi:hemerythrin
MEVAWSPRYSTGIEIIDDQHRELFRIVDRLRRMVAGGQARNLVEDAIVDLVACSEQHFITEEAYMTKMGYPDLEAHITEHHAMLGSLQDLLAKFRESEQAMALVVPTFMEGWLRHHISDGDFGFVSFLKSRNLV